MSRNPHWDMGRSFNINAVLNRQDEMNTEEFGDRFK